MNDSRKRQIEYGDWQTPDTLAWRVCERLASMGINPDVVIEPTCGVGAFVLASAEFFPKAKVLGFEENVSYLEAMKSKATFAPVSKRIELAQADFFATDWPTVVNSQPGKLLVVGNFPWVTSATQGSIGGANLPEKSNFQKFNGLDAITGKANFDISEWMLIEVLGWFRRREGDLAMLVKTAVARKILSYAEKHGVGVWDACLIEIDAKAHFNASVDACLLVMRFTADHSLESHDYSVFNGFSDKQGQRVGHRFGITVGDLAAFEESKHLLGNSPQKWRSGIKHDLSSVMELTQTPAGFLNGLGETVELEDAFLYPLMKGSDIGNSKKAWRNKFVIVTQLNVGDQTDSIALTAPKTFAYLETHSSALDGRGSTIYKKNPRFSIFGIGDYAFRPWKIAICGMYKKLNFRLIGPIDGKPVMFDDTVYFVSFDTEAEAIKVIDSLNSPLGISFLSCLIFWDEKRPIKTSILNSFDWRRLDATAPAQLRLPFPA
jgi:hypothetical protein